MSAFAMVWLKTVLACSALFLAASGCADAKKGPIIYYLDGAGWYSSSPSVSAGLRKAGYTGEFQTFSWSAFLGPAHDHLVTAHDKGTARRLAHLIERKRSRDPEGQINLMGLSAGTAVVLSALEQLKPGVQVDNVVLFSPTVSGERDLTRIMQHVRRNLYATSSPSDGIVGAIAVNADGKPGIPAGRRGFKLPRKSDRITREAYSRVVNLPWQPSYIGFDWTGGHTAVTNRDFVAGVIAPRILTSERYPLDRPIVERVVLGGRT
jgi:acetyl esterase/lipase